MRQGRGAVVAAALAVAVAVVAAGCGGGSGSSSSKGLLDPVSAAATKTENAGAARIRFRMVMGGKGLRGQTIRLGGTGAVDGNDAVMNIELGSMLSQIEKGLSPAKKLALGAALGNASMKEIIVKQNGDDVIYLRIPFLSSQIPGHKQWLKLDISKLGKSAGIDMSKLMSGSQFQPTDALSMLEAEGAAVQKVGPATIGGVATTKYHVVIDVAKELRAKGLTSPLFKGMAGRPKTIPANVWIDDGGLVRRVQLAYGLPGGAARLNMTMDLYDYGAQVDIAAPPSSRVFDMTQLAQQGFGSTH